MSRGRGTLVVRFIGDINDLQQKARAARRTVSQAGDGLVEAGKKLTLGLTVPFALGAAKAVSASSALGEAVSANTVVFGESAQAAEKWGRSMAASAGLSAREALSARAAFGNMLNTVGLVPRKALTMSKVLVQLAGDMASFSDQDPSEMLEKLRSGLAGEAEPLRRFGVLLSEAEVKTKAMALGLAGANGELSEAAKVQARYAIILEQTKVQQGDVARTSGSVANQMRRTRSETENAAASFGQVLEPVTKRLLQTTQAIVGVFEALPGPVKTGVVALLGLGAAVGPFLVLVGKIKIARAQLKLLEHQGVSVGRSFQTAGRLVRAAGLVAAIASVATALRDHFNKDVVTAGENFVQGFVAKLPEGGRRLNLLRAELKATTAQLEEMGAGNERLGQGELGPGSQQIRELRARVTILRDTIKDLEAEQKGAAAGAKAVGDALAGAGKQADKAAARIRAFAGMTGEEFDKWRESTIDAINPADDALAALANQARVTAADILKSFRDQVRDLKNYEENWTRLLRRGLPDGFAQQLQEMGIEGARVVAALATANQREFAAIVTHWQSAATRSKRIGDTIENNLSRAIEIPISFKVPPVSFESRQSRINRFHTGGTFHAPHGRTEGTALLRDGERILTPGQVATAGSGGSSSGMEDLLKQILAAVRAGGTITLDGEIVSRRVSERIGRSAARLARTA